MYTYAQTGNIVRYALTAVSTSSEITITHFYRPSVDLHDAEAG